MTEDNNDRGAEEQRVVEARKLINEATSESDLLPPYSDQYFKNSRYKAKKSKNAKENEHLTPKVAKEKDLRKKAFSIIIACLIGFGLGYIGGLVTGKRTFSMDFIDALSPIVMLVLGYLFGSREP